MPDNTPVEINFKTCTKCGETKPIDGFSKDARNKDGLQTKCKTCAAAYFEAYRAKHRDERLAYDKAYHASHRGESAAYRVVWRANNPTYHDVYYAEHREELAAYNAAWRKNNREKSCAQTRRHRARKSGNGGTHTAEDVQRQGDCQHWRCWWCGKKCKVKYHVDHLVPLAKGGHNDPSNIVISCPHCNQSKNDKMPDEWIGKLF